MQEFDNKGYLDMELLRFTTAGSVDDGKSTLIGRLLYDSKAIFEDQLEAVELSSKRKGEEHVNLALLTDGLKAEREQGITIDVAYRYFATPKRKFIIADTPGHIQYTRNMVTGASTANLAIILIDARNGVLEQTLRHTYIASLLQIPHIVFCINKMDLVDFKQEIFNNICDNINNISNKLNCKDIHFIPISALLGDNIVTKSENMTWYSGTTLLNLLETILISKDVNLKIPRFPIQYVIRPQNHKFHDYRGFAGRIESGIFKIGDKVTILPSKLSSSIKSINLFDKELTQAQAPLSVALTLSDEIDISRGDMIVKSDNIPVEAKEIQAMICWFNEKPLKISGKYLLKHTTNEIKCIIKEVIHKVDINTLDIDKSSNDIKMNDIAKISIKLAKSIYYDSYVKNRATGSFVLIEEGTNETICAGMII